MFILVADKG